MSKFIAYKMRDNLLTATMVFLFFLVILATSFPSMTGKVTYDLDNLLPICMYDNNKESYIIENLDVCCEEASKQLVCEETLKGYVCYTISGGARYELNSDAWKYCSLKI